MALRKRWTRKSSCLVFLASKKFFPASTMCRWKIFRRQFSDPSRLLPVAPIRRMILLFCYFATVPPPWALPLPKLRWPRGRKAGILNGFAPACASNLLKSIVKAGEGAGAPGEFRYFYQFYYFSHYVF